MKLANRQDSGVTPTYRLLEENLGEPLEPLVRRLRADERSFSYIARKLRERTGVEFSDEWLRLQFTESASATR